MNRDQSDFESMRLSVVEYLRDQSGLSLHPTVSGFVRHIGLKRTTFYSNYPELVALILESRVDGASIRKGRPRDERIRVLEETIATKNREKRELGAQHGVYAEQIRRLSLENAELRSALESARGVSQLRPKPSTAG